MKTKPVIRRAVRKDAPSLAKMMGKLARFHGDKPKAPAAQFIRHAFGRAALSQVWIAFVEKKPIGFAVTYDWMNFVRGKPTRTLDLLFVEEACRAQGVGQALIKALAADAKAKGFSRVTTSASKNNTSAQMCYLHLGFKEHKIMHKKFVAEGMALAKIAGKKS